MLTLGYVWLIKASELVITASLRRTLPSTRLSIVSRGTATLFVPPFVTIRRPNLCSMAYGDKTVLNTVFILILTPFNLRTVFKRSTQFQFYF